MLNQLSIRNFVLVDQLTLDWQSGMTVITGETGAGKSILLDALGLTLGDRAETTSVRQGMERAEVIAEFDVSNIPTAAQILKEWEADDDNHCVLRRIVQRDGGSKAWVNGVPVPLRQLKSLAELLIDIHGQHEHQSLLEAETQRQLLDDYGQHQPLLAQVQSHWQQWKHYQQRLDSLLEDDSKNQEQLDLLNYQLNEFDQLNIAEAEYEQLVQQQKILSHASEMLTTTQQIQLLLSESEDANVLSMVRQVENLFGNLPEMTGALQEAFDLVQQVAIEVDESTSMIRHAVDSIELNPQLLYETEQRLSALFDLARKHRIQPEELMVFEAQLREQLALLDGQQDSREALLAQAQQWQTDYQQASEKLSSARRKSAQKLSDAVNKNFAALAMSDAQLKIDLQERTLSSATAQGMESIEFLIRTNAGQPHQPIKRIVSGGELSRISLSIAVVTAQSMAKATMVFDEVDSGIGGATADVVGALLNNLGQYGQVICVTHLPQVASQGDQHLQVQKQSESDSTEVMIHQLSDEQRIEEIARMSGGQVVSDQARQLAKSMLERA